MALLDVSKVTEALMTLIEKHVTSSPEWTSAMTLEVSPDPPDELSGSSVLGLYLYHLAEDPGTKNLPAVGNASAPVRFSPMGLTLYYQLSAHTDGNGGSVLAEQRLMGLAAKALHDVPVIDDATQVGGVPVLPGPVRGEGNRLRIALQPIPFNEAVSFWTAGSLPLRLAAYYEVSVVLLEPDVVLSRPGRVLSRAVWTFAGGFPRLEGSRSVASLTVPGEAQPRELELRPAQVPPGGLLELTGAGLAGTTTRLALRSPRWRDRVEVDATTWGVAATSERVSATVRKETGPGGEAVLPGVYGAVVVVTRTSHGSAGRQDLELPSNETALVVLPRVDQVTPQPAGLAAGEFEWTGGIFEHQDLTSIEAWYGETRLQQATTGPVASGQFQVVDAATLRARLPASIPSGEVVPFRLLVNGAESLSRWVTAP